MESQTSEEHILAITHNSSWLLVSKHLSLGVNWKQWKTHQFVYFLIETKITMQILQNHYLELSTI